MAPQGAQCSQGGTLSGAMCGGPRKTPESLGESCPGTKVVLSLENPVNFPWNPTLSGGSSLTALSSTPELMGRPFCAHTPLTTQEETAEHPPNGMKLGSVEGIGQCWQGLLT